MAKKDKEKKEVRKYRQYDKEFHIPLLIELFEKGKEICHFCAVSGICRTTFHYWRKEHKEFQAAYEDALELAERFWINVGDQNCCTPGFNDKYWSRKMMNRFGYANTRTVHLKGIENGGSIVDSFNHIFHQGVLGNLTPGEMGQFINALLTGAKIVESIKMSDELKFIKEHLGLDL